MNIFHEDMQEDTGLEIYLNERPSKAYKTPSGSFLLSASKGIVSIDITTKFDFDDVKIRPLHKKIVYKKTNRRLYFTTEMPANNRPMHLQIEFDGHREQPLLIFLNPLDSDIPKEQDCSHHFSPGVHDLGIISLKSNDTVYLEEGAVVQGAFHAKDAENIKIMGKGILDAYPFRDRKGEDRVSMIELIRCKNVFIGGITIIGNSGWTVVQAGCDGNLVKNVKILNWGKNGDGFDIVSTKNTQILDCFARCFDDCIALKSLPEKFDGIQDNLENIVVKGGTYYNLRPGNALEIGFETQCEYIENITFEDLDIIGVEANYWQSGAVFSIHNGDRAVVRDIVVKNIRVEQAMEKLFDLKIVLSQYSKDTDRGHIEGVHLKDIAISDGPLPPSIFQGMLMKNLVKNVKIENLTYKGKKIENIQDMKVIIEKSRDIHVV